MKLLRKDLDKHYNDNSNMAKHISLLAEEQISLAEKLEMSNRSYGEQLLTHQVKSLMHVTKQIFKNTATHMQFTADILEGSEEYKKREKEKEQLCVKDFIPIAIFISALLFSGVVVNH